MDGFRLTEGVTTGVHPLVPAGVVPVLPLGLLGTTLDRDETDEVRLLMLNDRFLSGEAPALPPSLQYILLCEFM